jgi:Predicted GTPase
MIRVYTKEPRRDAEMSKPFILAAGASVADLARKVHQGLLEKMRFARLLRRGQHQWMQVKETEILQDHDVVEIHQ